MSTSTTRPLQPFANAIAMLAIAPLLLAASAALMLVFTAKLIFALAATVFES